MDQEIEIVSENYDRRVFTMAGENEARQYQRVFPPNLPKGWYLHHEWIAHNKFLIEPRPIPVAAGADSPIEDARTSSAVHTMDEASLKTRAAELGIKTKNRTREEIAADVAAAELEPVKT